MSAKLGHELMFLLSTHINLLHYLWIYFCVPALTLKMNVSSLMSAGLEMGSHKSQLRPNWMVDEITGWSDELVYQTNDITAL